MSPLLKISALIFSILFVQQAIAQNIKSYGYVEVGFSTMERDFCDQFIEQTEYNHNISFSWALGFDLEYQFYKNTFIGSGLKLSALGGRDEFSILILDNGVEGRIINESKIRSYYIGAPLFIRYQFNKIGLRAGYQFSYALGGNFETQNGRIEGVIPPNYSYETGASEQDATFDAFDGGILIGFNYKITEIIHVSLNHYLGLSQFNADIDPTAYCRENNQFTLGLQFYL